MNIKEEKLTTEEEGVLDVAMLTAMLDDEIQNHDDWQKTAAALCESQGIYKHSFLGSFYSGFTAGVIAATRRLFDISENE